MLQMLSLITSSRFHKMIFPPDMVNLVNLTMINILTFSMLYHVMSFPFEPPIVEWSNNYHACVNWPTWKASNLYTPDCHIAVQNLYVSEIRTHPNHRITLTGNNSPKRYTGSTFFLSFLESSDLKCPESCTVILVMLYKFNYFELPGRIVHGASREDTFTLQEVYDAAMGIENECVRSRRLLGWQPIGLLFL